MCCVGLLRGLFAIRPWCGKEHQSGRSDIYVRECIARETGEECGGEGASGMGRAQGSLLRADKTAKKNKKLYKKLGRVQYSGW